MPERPVPKTAPPRSFYLPFKRIPLQRRSWLFLIAIAGIFLAGVIIIFFGKSLQSDPIPSDVAAQAGFTIYFPRKPWLFDKQRVSYDKKTKIVSMTANDSSNPLVSINLTEQAAPTQFFDIPQYYPVLLDKLNEYTSLSVPVGTLYLTHPTELKGGQEAVMVNGGTLLFAHPSKNIPDDTWRQFFRSFDSVNK